MARFFGVARNVPFPSVDVDAAPLCGIFINRQWADALLSLVSHADNPYFYDDPPIDDVEAQAYTLFLRIREATGMIGAIVPYASTIPPTGTLPCDGSAHARSDYPALYAALPPALQVDADTFTTPDLRGLFILSAGAGYSPFDTGGSVSVTLDESQIPPHSHFSPPHTHFITGSILSGAAPPVPPAIVPVLAPNPLPDVTSADSVAIDTTGGGQPHDNMPPFIALAYAIVAL